MPEGNAKSLSFHGSFCHGIDGSHRVLLPAKWRPDDASFEFTIILMPIRKDAPVAERHLLALQPDRWQEKLAKVRGANAQNKGLAAVERTLASNSVQLALDKAGRLCLPEDLAEKAGLTKDVQFVPRLDKFEMWNPERYEAQAAADESLASTMAEELDL
jgi:MraZ protein